MPMRITLQGYAIAVTAFVALTGGAQAENKVELRVVKYPELAKTVKQHKGKVIVVDFWADW